ncbi:MAG: DUF177 domain-containing protein [Acetanaerobacterium sp.]
MLIALRQLFDNENERIALDYNFDFTGLELWGRCPFASGIHVVGEIVNHTGIVTLTYTASFTLGADCDRCLEHFERAETHEFSHILVLSLNGEDTEEFVVLKDAQLDLTELVTSDVVLTLPVKLLCSDDCKGLCQMCGANRNHTMCSCIKKERDPRLAALEKLLD